MRTLWSNVLNGVAGLPQNIARYFELIANFQPDVVISDFESWTYFYGQTNRLPILSIDNMQIINRCTLPEEILEGHRAEFKLTKAFIKSKLPFCNEYYITTFFNPTIRKDRTRLFPPILRPEILSAQRSDGEHLLVYTTGEDNEAFTETLAKTGLECRIYGMKREIQQEQVEGKLRFQPFSEAKFIADLASCRALVAGGGFTLMGEAVYLHKPMLAVPLDRQFEQVLNARYLEHEGFGKCSMSLEDPATIRNFLETLPAFQSKLASYHQEDNRLIFAALDDWLEKAATGTLDHR